VTRRDDLVNSNIRCLATLPPIATAIMHLCLPRSSRITTICSNQRASSVSDPVCFLLSSLLCAYAPASSRRSPSLSTHIRGTAVRKALCQHRSLAHSFLVLLSSRSFYLGRLSHLTAATSATPSASSYEGFVSFMLNIQ
jgi:hypothetical protein